MFRLKHCFFLSCCTKYQYLAQENRICALVISHQSFSITKICANNKLMEVRGEASSTIYCLIVMCTPPCNMPLYTCKKLDDNINILSP